jgi:hypothetical protein
LEAPKDEGPQTAAVEIAGTEDGRDPVVVRVKGSEQFIEWYKQIAQGLADNKQFDGHFFQTGEDG